MGILQKITLLNCKRIFQPLALFKKKTTKPKFPLLLHTAVRFFTGEILTVKGRAPNNPKKYQQIFKGSYIK